MKKTNYDIAQMIFKKGRISVQGDYMINIRVPYKYHITTTIHGKTIESHAQWHSYETTLKTKGSLIVHWIKLKRKL